VILKLLQFVRVLLLDQERRKAKSSGWCWLFCSWVWDS